MAYSYIRKGNIGINRYKANGIIYRSIQSNFATDMYVCVYTKSFVVSVNAITSLTWKWDELLSRMIDGAFIRLRSINSLGELFMHMGVRDQNHRPSQPRSRHYLRPARFGGNCQPLWPSGKAEGPRFESASALLSLEKLWSVDTVLWLCPSQLMKH